MADSKVTAAQLQLRNALGLLATHPHDMTDAEYVMLGRLLRGALTSLDSVSNELDPKSDVPSPGTTPADHYLDS